VQPVGCGGSSPQPTTGRIEEVTADGQTPVEHVAHHLLTGQDSGEGDRGTGHDGEPAFGGIGGRGVGIDGGDLEGELDPADAGQVDGQAQEIGPVGERGKGPGEGQREVELVGRFLVFGEAEDGVLEGEQGAGVDLQSQMEIEGAAAAVLGMELDLPDLAERVGLHEVTLVVHMETMIDGMILEVGHVSGHIDDCHRKPSLPVSPGPGSPPVASTPMEDGSLLAVLHDAASAVTEALAGLGDWGLAGTREGQYRSDLAADAAAVGVLDKAGLGVMSEESGIHRGDREIVVALDPVDGSTNAARGIPWYATSLCAVDGDGLRAAVVVNQASGVRFEAHRGGGARRDGVPVQPSGCTVLREAIIGFSGYPPTYLGWSQYRGLGAAALDLCAVADGTLDGYAVVGSSSLGSWDYLGGMLVCIEAGAVLGEIQGRELVTLSHTDRRTPVAAATPSLLAELRNASAGSVVPSGV